MKRYAVLALLFLFFLAVGWELNRAWHKIFPFHSADTLLIDERLDVVRETLWSLLHRAELLLIIQGTSLILIIIALLTTLSARRALAKLIGTQAALNAQADARLNRLERFVGIVED